MAYEFLKKLFGTSQEGEAPKTMTYAELEAAIDADKNLKLTNLNDGSFVPKADFDAKVIELNGVQGQLNTANDTIKGFNGKSAKDIQEEISGWETKYNTDTENLRKQLEDQARAHAEEMFLTGYKFTSKAARNGVLADLRSKEFKLENGTLLGAKEYMDNLMNDDEYKGAFVAEEPTEENAKKPRFAQSTNGGGGSGDKKSVFDFGFNFISKPPEQK